MALFSISKITPNLFGHFAYKTISLQAFYTTQQNLREV